jgi:hypothetical protein
VSTIGQQIIPGWSIISAELRNVLDGSALRSLFAMRLKPNSIVGFTRTLEKKIIPLFRKQKGFKGEIMLCYAIFDLYPTRFSLLMQDFGLVVAGAMAVVLLCVFAMGLTATVLSIILLLTYLLGVLRPAIQKIALRLQKGVLKENKVPAPAAVRFPDRAWALLFAARGTHPDPNLLK